MNSNLHLHSRYSDGTTWPDEAAARAKRAGLECAALTDHDSFGGTEEFAAAAERAGLRFITAAEIDCEESSVGYRSELLAYFPYARPIRTAALLDTIGAERREKIRQAVERSRGVFSRSDLSFEALRERKTDGRGENAASSGFSFNKVDVFRYLLDEGVLAAGTDYRAFKEEYFDSGRLMESGISKPNCRELISLVHEDGGFVVIPHFGHEFGDSARSLEEGARRSRELVSYFAEAGADGMELYAYRGSDRDELNEAVAAIAEREGLFVTYGSDCHGPGSGKDTIFSFSGEFAGFPEKPRR